MILELVASHDSAGSVSAYTLLVNWHALQQQLAAFLAWWMPLNLLGYLAILALTAADPGYEVKPEAVSLVRLLASTLLTLPLLALLLGAFILGEVTARRARPSPHRPRRGAR